MSLNEAYAYPPEVELWLSEVLDLIDKEGVLSIVLLGSTCRGELSYIVDEVRCDLLSDLEMLVVTTGRTSRETSFHDRLSEWEREHAASNPLFHVDVTFVPLRVLRRMTPIVRSFDMQATGAVVYGDDLAAEMPAVTAVNINRGQTRELLLTRLWNALVYTPASVVFGRAGPYEELIFRYVQCRNLLDVPTILLPLEGALFPTYQERVEFIQHEFASGQWAQYFDPQFPYFLREALIGKMELTFEASMRELHQRNVGAYLDLARYFLGDPTLSRDHHDVCDKVVCEGLKFLTGRAHKWFAYDVHVALGKCRRKNTLDWCTWVVSRKRENLVCFLVAMHEALGDFLAGRPSSSAVDRAAAYLSRVAIAPAQDRSDHSPEERWLSLREAFVSDMGTILRFSTRHQRHLMDAVRWQYAA